MQPALQWGSNWETWRSPPDDRTLSRFASSGLRGPSCLAGDRGFEALLEGLSLGFAKLASCAKNTNMGRRRINFITGPGKEQKRWRISR
jgi:hypothetical protein